MVHSTSGAPDWALALIPRLRELTPKEKAHTATRLQLEQGWTLGQIGALFGVTRQAVSLWVRYGETTASENAAWYREYQRQQNWERAAVSHRDWRNRYRHGLGSWAALWEAQNGLCYLCERPLGPDRPAVVEHDHRCCAPPKSCWVCRRGLACSPCNRIIGFAGDDPDRVALIAANLKIAADGVTTRMAERAAKTCKGA